MTKQTESLRMLLLRTEPSGEKTEYHGNGKNAWHGTTLHARCGGHTIRAEMKSHRYSYRWHKTKTTYYLDDAPTCNRGTFKAKLRRAGIAA
ncbi:MAG: hypothetical protein GY820_39710 [Gammaproteobacteria bacterium]|nr:hypothetical protein [Gammaproteobacteria bacterium]